MLHMKCLVTWGRKLKGARIWWKDPRQKLFLCLLLLPQAILLTPTRGTRGGLFPQALVLAGNCYCKLIYYFHKFNMCHYLFILKIVKHIRVSGFLENYRIRVSVSFRYRWYPCYLEWMWTHDIVHAKMEPYSSIHFTHSKVITTSLLK